MTRLSDPERRAGVLALTMGDPAGIGIEIAALAWRARLSQAVPAFVLIADPDLVAARLAPLGMGVPLARLASACEAVGTFATALPILPPATPVRDMTAGRPSSENAAATTAAIDMAVDLALTGRACGVVTAPIAKAVLQAAGFGFPGHTEYLGALAERRGLGASPVMMLVGGGLRAIPVTIHIPLRDVPAALTPGRIVEAARVTHRALRTDFAIPAPRLALTGLNPHAGEGGAMGTEEQEIIVPAMAQLRREGIDTLGPLPADSAFHAAARVQYDAVLAMYHDQALIPVKTLAFDEGVNVTLGLPFVRTSPDHGTAFDIAGSGVARPDSLIAALKLAAWLAATRARAQPEALA